MQDTQSMQRISGTIEMPPHLRCGNNTSGSNMNWQKVFRCVQEISGSRPDAPRAIVQLRHEVVASSQLTPAEIAEIHGVLDGLQHAGLYQKVALVGQLIEVLSRHGEFKAKFVHTGGKQS